MAALAASLVLPALDGEAAAALAEAEGLVTHLTSLVLVDEAGAAQEGLPGARKVLLPDPRTSVMAMAAMPAQEFVPAGDARMRSTAMMRRASPAPSGGAPQSQGCVPPSQFVTLPVLAGVGARIDWDNAPAQLRAGDLSSLDSDIADMIRMVAAEKRVLELADELDLDPVLLVIGLIARAHGGRSATRLAQAIFSKTPAKAIDAVAQVLQLI